MTHQWWVLLLAVVMSEMDKQAATQTGSGRDRWAHLPPPIREEIDVFEAELRRFQQGLMPEKVFLEFRLRHGVYGQRQGGGPGGRQQEPPGLLDTLQLERLADL